MAQLKDLLVNGNARFVNDINVNGDAIINGSIKNLATDGGIYWNPYVESATDASDVAKIYLSSSGSNTTLNISIANDSGDVINLESPCYIHLKGKRAFQINDNWLRINADSGFSSGIYTGTSLVRSDKALQVGDGGSAFYANTTRTYVQSKLAVGGTNDSYNLYVNGTSYFVNNANLKNSLYKIIASNSDTPMIWMNGQDYDGTLFTISSGTTTNSYYGYYLRYLGTGSAIDNNLVLYADNQNSSSKITAFSVNQSGNIGFNTLPDASYRLKVNGTSYFNDQMIIDKDNTGLAVGGTATNISGSIFTPSAGIQIIAGAGGATCSTAIGFHNPNISSAVLMYKNTDANTGYFLLNSDDTTWGVSIGEANSAYKLYVKGTGYFTDTVRITATTGSYREGIRLEGADSTWRTITLGGTVGGSGTGENVWSIHRKNDNNFSISRNSSDGVNGLVMTKTGMGLGTTAPTDRLHIVGKVYIQNDTDVTKSNKTGSLVIGSKDGANLAFDGNEIMARNGTAVSTLYLQNEAGGDVDVGEDVNIHRYLKFTTNSYPGNIIAKNASGQKRYEIYTNSTDGSVNDVVMRVYTAADASAYKAWVFKTNGNFQVSGGRALASSGFTVDETISLWPSNSNEINFGGSYKENKDIWFGYRSVDGRPQPNAYHFGMKSNLASVYASKYYIMDSNGANIGSYGSSTQPIYWNNGVPTAISSYGGNSATADKWKTARSFTIGNSTKSVDGSGNVSWTLAEIMANGSGNTTNVIFQGGTTYLADAYTVASGNTNTYPWHLIAKSPLTGSNWVDADVIILISSYFDGGHMGIIKLNMRTNDQSSAANSSASAIWLVRKGFAVDDIRWGLYKNGKNSTADFYVRTSTYNRMTIKILSPARYMTLYSSSEGNSSANPTYAYTDVAAGGTALNGAAYTATGVAIDQGQVYMANRIADSNNNNAINITYSKAGQASTSWLASWNGSELGSISPANVTAGKARALKNYYTARQASADIAVVGDGTVKTFLATSTMTTNKPMADGFITHYEWDNIGGFSNQMFISNGTNPHMQIRGMSGGTWGNWVTMLDGSNYTSYTVTKTGGGASGTWGISISGNADTLDGYHATDFVFDKARVSGNMNTAASWRNAVGMINLSGTDTTVNPNGQTGWHHFINMSYLIETSNMWQTQIANKAGTTDLWVRSRNGGAVTDGTAWAAGWTRILTGTNYTNVTDGRYVKKAGDTMTGILSNSTVTGGTWIKGTHEGAFRVTAATSAILGQHYQAWFSGKTPAGAWSIGCLSGSETLYFVYGSDANYNAGTNSANTSAKISTDGKVYGAVWNDYAEYRTSHKNQNYEPGRVVVETGKDTLKLATKRLEPAAAVVSDTYGFAIGETETAKTPIAVTGRVLVYTYQDRNKYHAGDCVCAAPKGTVDIMTREEIKEYPDRILGIVSAVPEYETWGTSNVAVNGRIWITIK